MDEVRYERIGAAAVLTIDRRERRNAVDAETAGLLLDGYREFEADDGARALVLTGEGPEAFCAGADLKALAAGKPNRVEPGGDAPMGPTRFLLRKPVIAAVAGFAVAGGFELACWCDLRVMEEDATFGVFCRRWGVPLIDGGTVRLPRLIGLSRALDLILTGRPVPAAEALGIGLANRVVPTGQSRQAAESLARDLASLPQLCLRNDRLSAYEQFGMTLPEAMDNEFAHGWTSLAHAAEGVDKFTSGAGRHGKPPKP
jgi:enoyl-CoA hydratase